METSTQENRETLARARKQYAVTQTSKSAQRLRKGITRFVGEHRRSVSSAAVLAVVVFAAGRLIAQARTTPRIVPRLTNGFAAGKKPLRRAVRSLRTSASRNPQLSNAALTGAAALIGTGVALLLAPSWFMRFTKH